MARTHLPNPGLTPTAEPFEKAVGRVAERLKGVLTELLSRTIGDGANTVDIQRELGIDKKLAWQVFRLATGEDVVAEAANLPGKRSFVRLLAAFRERGATEKLIERLKGEYESFDRLIADHAGDRASLDVMIAGLSPEQNEPLGVKTRKSLFDAQSQVWGYRAKAVVTCQIYHRTSETTLGTCRLGISMGLHTLRHGTKIRLQAISWQMWQPTTPDDPGVATGHTQTPVLIPEFCRGIQVTSDHQNWGDQGKQMTVSCGGVGRSNQAEIVLLSRTLDTPLPEPVEEMWYQSRKCIGIPCEVFYYDLLVPAGWTNTATGRVRTFFAAMNPEDVWKNHPDDLLPMRESVTYRGRVRPGAAEDSGEVGMPTIPEVPRYRELLRTVLNDFGWQDTEFDVYRCRIEYPIPHSVIEIHVDGVKMKQ